MALLQRMVILRKFGENVQATDDNYYSRSILPTYYIKFPTKRFLLTSVPIEKYLKTFPILFIQRPLQICRRVTSRGFRGGEIPYDIPQASQLFIQRATLFVILGLSGGDSRTFILFLNLHFIIVLFYLMGGEMFNFCHFFFLCRIHLNAFSIGMYHL